MRIDVSFASQLLMSGRVVAIPTETVYGLAARLSDEAAIRRVFALKHRPADNPLIVHLAGPEALSFVMRRLPPRFDRLARFWPGPLTVVGEADPSAVPAVARAGLLTVAARVPDHELAHALLKEVGPLVAPSANPSGFPSATRPEDVEHDFGDDFPVLDGGPCREGVESTIIELKTSGWRILRPGAISPEKLVSAFGEAIVESDAPVPLTPGRKHRHYAPRARLVPCPDRTRLLETAAENKALAVVGFDDSDAGLHLLSLGPRGDFSRNLRELYGVLRRLDREGIPLAVVDMDFPPRGLGITLRDRLARAAE